MKRIAVINNKIELMTMEEINAHFLFANENKAQTMAAMSTTTPACEPWNPLIEPSSNITQGRQQPMIAKTAIINVLYFFMIGPSDMYD